MLNIVEFCVLSVYACVCEYVDALCEHVSSDRASPFASHLRQRLIAKRYYLKSYKLFIHGNVIIFETYCITSSNSGRLCRLCVCVGMNGRLSVCVSLLSPIPPVLCDAAVFGIQVVISTVRLYVNHS